MNYSDYEHILFEKRQPHILWVTLNRPEVLNAANGRMHTELVALWETIERDPEVQVVVVTGAGRFVIGDRKRLDQATQTG
jgi:enoyl-CoA hydratase